VIMVSICPTFAKAPIARHAASPARFPASSEPNALIIEPHTASLADRSSGEESQERKVKSEDLRSPNKSFPASPLSTSPETIGTPAGVNFDGVNPSVSIVISRYFFGEAIAAGALVKIYGGVGTGEGQKETDLSGVMVSINQSLSQGFSGANNIQPSGVANADKVIVAEIVVVMIHFGRVIALDEAIQEINFFSRSLS
jgi:hypothetical protein